MSDTPQGPDWWQASDDRWYPPPRPEMPGDTGYPTAPPTAPVHMGGPVLGGPGGPGVPGGPPSPYGGIPAGAPPGGANRTALFVTMGVLAAVVLVVVMIAVSSGGGDDDDPGPVAQATTTTTEADVDITPPEDIELPDEPEPQDISVLEVVETGWSIYPDYSDETTGSYGFLVVNNGDEVITGASISVTVKNESDGIITTDSFRIGTIRPGQTLGFGDELLDPVTDGIGDVTVQIGANEFPGDPPPDGELTVANVTTNVDEFSGMTTTFSVTSTYEQQLDLASPYVIFRDANGQIIGGAYGFMDFIPAGGEQSGEVTTFSTVPNVATTEVYVDPGEFF